MFSINLSKNLYKIIGAESEFQNKEKELIESIPEEDRDNFKKNLKIIIFDNQEENDELKTQTIDALSSIFKAVNKKGEKILKISDRFDFLSPASPYLLNKDSIESFVDIFTNSTIPSDYAFNVSENLFHIFYTHQINQDQRGKFLKELNTYLKHHQNSFNEYQFTLEFDNKKETYLMNFEDNINNNFLPRVFDDISKSVQYHIPENKEEEDLRESAKKINEQKEKQKLFGFLAIIGGLSIALVIIFKKKWFEKILDLFKKKKKKDFSDEKK